MALTLGDALEDPLRLPWLTGCCFRPVPWHAMTLCRVANLDDLPDEVDLPADAVHAGFTTTLDVASVQDVIDNLLQQVPVPDLDLRLRAYDYYMENDAFMAASSAK